MTDASIIICTRNRAEALRRTLDTLHRMHVPAGVRHEVIVADNASSDDTARVVEAASAHMPVRCVREDRPGAGRARNAALAEARGAMVFITDDDCHVGADWLAVGMAILAAEPRQLVGGRIDLHDPRDLPLTIKTETEPAQLSSVGRLFGFIHGCNMICGRCVLDEIGLFDPRLGAGTRCKAAEDTDLVYRALRAGIPVRYRPELRLSHDHGRRDPEVGERLTEGYFAGFGSMALKHLLKGRPELLKAAYWQMWSEARRGRPIRLRSYLLGALRYARSALERDAGAPRRPPAKS